MSGIRRFACVFLCLSMMFASVGPAQVAPAPEPDLEPVAPAEAGQPAPQPAAPASNRPAVDQPLTEEQRQMLQQKIDVGTINVEQLREVVDGPAEAERLRLTLQECIELALLQSPDIQVTQLERFKSDADLMTAKGEFDPLLTGQAQYTHAIQQANAAYRLFGNLTSVEAYSTTSSVTWAANYTLAPFTTSGSTSTKKKPPTTSSSRNGAAG